jgi:hypothetical protein
MISQNRESSHGEKSLVWTSDFEHYQGPYDIKMVLNENPYKSQGTKPPLVEPLAKLNTLLSLAALTLIIYSQKC